MAAQCINNMNACILVICPLTSIIKDQITETRSLGIKRVSLLEISFLELKESAFEIVFCSAERVMEKQFSEQLSSRCQISNFRWLIYYRIPVVFGVEVKKIQRSLQAHFLVASLLA